ncbi:maleylpyruvate isomerase family mycothiol-dependent enzyme [Streptacidiphilus neutrinimicus]|uniref:maleylpyruvate isomerase family mycothiol-dependent enzyme n=1 Tax=Streptacidiphilus neutrinimicus TaxID=105420 RepID=UPI0005A7EA2D|nr:maleylpyruvate isomerase family mycothiol-dependent enzyme [Streptacidiphilus neutrinimicus]
MTEPSVQAAPSPLLLREVVAVAEDIAAVLKARPDADVPIPGASWSVGEAAAHLALANELMADLARGVERPYGDGTPDSLAAANTESLAAFPQRDPLVLADAIVAPARDFVTAASERSAADPVVTPMGPMDLGVLGSYLLVHMLGHGYDLARALGRPHMIDRQRVELSLPFLLLAMPRVVDPRTTAGVRADYAIGLRGGDRFGVRIDDQVAQVSPRPPRRPDCTIVTEPVTFLLLALGRCDPWAAIARGRILAWGRKPWLAAGFPTYFTAP